jgi:ESCRT-I complex subunit VPS28
MSVAMEVSLWRDKREHELLDSLAYLFAIIKTTEKLEKAYICNLVSSDHYELECLKLIAQFKSLSASIVSSVPSIERFSEAYKLDCPHALNQLIISGVPTTVEHRAAFSAAASSAAATSASAIARCVQNFIIAMDTIKLNMIVVDWVHPLLSDLSTSFNKLAGNLLPPDFEGKVKVREWLARLAKMGATDELTEQQNSNRCIEIVMLIALQMFVEMPLRTDVNQFTQDNQIFLSHSLILSNCIRFNTIYL